MSLWRHLTRGLRVLTRRAAADRDIDDELRHWVDEAAAQHVGARPRSGGGAPRRARRDRPADAGPRARPRPRLGAVGRVVAAGSAARRPHAAADAAVHGDRGAGRRPRHRRGDDGVQRDERHPAAARCPASPIPARLVALQPARRDGGTAEQVGYPRYLHLRDHARSVDGIAAWGRAPFTIAAGGEGTAVLGNLVTANYFDVLGVAPVARPLLHGRREPHAGHASGAGRLARVLAGASRRRRRARSAGAISVNGHPFTLIGVAPPAFRGLYTGMVFDAWAPVMMQPQLRPRTSLQHGSWLWAFARLRPGDRRGGGRRRAVGADAPRTGERSASPTRRTRCRACGPRRSPACPGGSGPASAFLGLLLGAAALVLVDRRRQRRGACSSARYVARGRDLAVRAALGAGRLRLIRQLLTEVLALFGLGALGGFVVASAATTALERLPLPASSR